MGRLVRGILLLAAVAASLALVSYLGSRATTGRFLGEQRRDVGARTVQFAYKGVAELPGHPRAWVYTYGPTAIPGLRTIKIYVGPTGTLLGTDPADLDQRLEQIRAKEPG